MNWVMRSLTATTASAVILSGCGSASNLPRTAVTPAMSNPSSADATQTPTTTHGAVVVPTVPIPATTVRVPPTRAPVKAKPSKPISPAAACGMRPPATGEILVRSVTTDDPPTVLRLGGGWVWNWGDKKCITSVQFAIDANPTMAGFCAQVALVSANLGYDEDAVPAPRLKKVIASTGSC